MILFLSNPRKRTCVEILKAYKIWEYFYLLNLSSYKCLFFQVFVFSDSSLHNFVMLLLSLLLPYFVTFDLIFVLEGKTPWTEENYS